MDNLTGTHRVVRAGADAGTLTISQRGNMTMFELISDLESRDILRLAGVSHKQEYAIIGVAEPEGGMLKLRKSFSKSALKSLDLDESAGFFLILRDEKFRADAEPSLEEPPEQTPEPLPENPPDPLPESDMEAVIPQEPLQAITPLQAAAPPPEPPRVTRISPSPSPSEVPSVSPEVPRVEEEPSESTAAAGWKPISDPSRLFTDPDIAAACAGAKGCLTMQADGITLLAVPVVPDEPFPMMPVFCFGDSVKINGREYIVFKSKNGNFVI